MEKQFFLAKWLLATPNAISLFIYIKKKGGGCIGGDFAGGYLFG